jgi:hypothetical protein
MGSHGRRPLRVRNLSAPGYRDCRPPGACIARWLTIFTMRGSTTSRRSTTAFCRNCSWLSLRALVTAGCAFLTVRAVSQRRADGARRWARSAVTRHISLAAGAAGSRQRLGPGARPTRTAGGSSSGNDVREPAQHETRAAQKQELAGMPVSLDHLVSAGEKHRGHRDTERLGRAHVQHELELGRLLD